MSDEEKTDEFAQILLKAADGDAIRTTLRRLYQAMAEANEHDPAPRKVPGEPAGPLTIHQA